MEGWGANTDIPVRVQGEDMHLYAMVLPVILAFLPSQQQRVGDVEEAGLYYSQAACVCFSIALVALTASCPLPCSSKALQICLFHLILGCALVLSLAVPNMLCWAPYFSCIRPIFHLLPRSLQLRILLFIRSVFDAIKGLVGLVSFVVGSIFQMLRSPFGHLIGQSNASGRLVAVGVSRNPPQSSSPVQADFNSQQVVELAEGGRLVAVGVAQSSSPAREANTDIPVPERIQGEDMSLYAMVLPLILGYLSSQQQRVGDVEEAGLYYSQAACVCFSIALVALTASCPLPCSSKAQQICLFHLILGCSFLLSLAVPNMLCWAPYFSCIRPIFHLLPRSFQLRILQFIRSVFDAIKGLVGLVSFVVGSLFQMLRSPFGLLIGQSNASGRFVAVGVSLNPPQSSSPVQADFNSQQVVELAEGGRLEAVGVAQSSSPARANFNSQQVVEAVELRVQSSNAIRRLVAVGASPAQSSSPAQANFAAGGGRATRARND